MLFLLLNVALGGPLAGEAFPEFDATPVTPDVVTAVPDTEGRYLVIELIRSADW
ncbi:MAG: hypothetical protein ACI9MC_001669 [Kiritimatiellia bacterium]|jgi:hypothetical protein